VSTSTNFQELILRLDRFWADQGCVISQPYDIEVGAGTLYPHTFLKCLGPAPWRTAYVAPSRRPQDGRYGKNPYRFQYYFQYQVILKPSPLDIQDLYIQSLGEALGIDTARHDLRFVEDNWEQPSLGAWGLGWEVWLDGMEISQFTYFQQMAGIDCKPVSGELTYGLERLAMYVQGVNHAFDVVYAPSPDPQDPPVTIGDLRRDFERQHCIHNFEESDPAVVRQLLELYEIESKRLTAKGLIYPAYEYAMKVNHAFNLLDARGALSQMERQAMVLRIRELARGVASAYLESIGAETPSEAGNA